MNESQELHLENIKTRALELIDEKYRRGAEEHQGDLLQLPITKLVDEALNETIDLLVYLLTLKEHVTDLQDRIQEVADNYSGSNSDI